MASVSSLDKDLRKMRLDKYTPAAANEARNWIEGILGERLPSTDLLEGLKDGVALCRLINLAVPPPGIRFKKSPMPFVQMENISLFLRACQSPPLNLQQHDVFLTVDLYEQKDPAQVLQCLGAFSRAAHNLNPDAFPTSIGPKARGLMSPQSTGAPATPLRARHESNASNTSSAYGPGGTQRPVLAPSGTGGSDGRRSPIKSPSNGSTSPGVAVSSWSRREHEGSTAPAWNIAQYGYMGGASQGNLGIAFGGRRQITSASPYVPNLADKERKRKEEAERKRLEAEEEERQRRAELEAEEERARIEEERRWEEETRKAREDERRKVEEEKRQWEEEERMWRLTEEKRRKEEEEAEARLDKERQRARSRSRGPLRGQYLSQYQAEQAPAAGADDQGNGYTSRVKELERELELARQREHEYERERRGGQPPREEVEEAAQRRARSRSRGEPTRQDSWVKGQREYLTVSPKPQHQPQFQPQQQPQLPPRSPQLQPQQQPQLPPRSPQLQAQKQPQPQLPPKSPRLRSRSPQPQPQPQPPPRSPQPAASSRPLPNPMTATSPPPVRTHNTGGRPLPNPAAYASPPAQSAASPPTQQPAQNRTDRFLASNPAPQPPAPQTTYSRELDATSERDAEDRRRAQRQAPTKAGGWASKSLLEREMEMERQRQREWEEAQRETAEVARKGAGEAVDGVGGRWDVSQWSGFTGGDNQNQVGTGIGAGRRQIVGPRPLPGPPK